MSNQLKNRLINQGVVSESTFNEVPSSFAWPIKLLLAICGWLGGLCLLGIFFGAFTLFFQSAVASAVVALIMFVVAQRILSAPNNEFIEHLGLALSFSAQVLYGWALLPLEHVQVILLSFAILQAVLVLIMPSMTHRVWSTLSCCAAISGVLISCGLPSLLSSVLLLPMVWLSLNEFRFPASYRFVSGIKYGLVLSIVVLLCAEVFRAEVGSLLVSNADAIFTLPYWVAPIAYMLSICISVGYLLCHHQVWFRSKVVKLAVIFTILIAVLTSMAPGVGASLIILVTAFAQSNRMMIGLGAIALLVYSSTYYYMMETTLLFKSGVLMSVALVMLVSYLVFNKVLNQAKG
ncbi:DUF4401 domain-containing protein [Vibrio europaeus]|uniref:DUF4401 domain-containing protein n=1 Tax=Vibrio europaeus TaxID=300876 RepID=UPI002341B25C|nr:DUF4401 domain-containing protein [Vibrio europaeus]MDC5848738.1 DUF4401 domain-containing protein [Vibrio europaeus]